MELTSPKRILSRAPFLRVVLPFVLGLAVVARSEQVTFSLSTLFIGLTPLLVGVLLLPAGEGWRWLRGAMLMVWSFVFGAFWWQLGSPAADPVHVSKAPTGRAMWFVQVEAMNGITPKLIRADVSLVARADNQGLHRVRGLVMVSLMRSEDAVVPTVGDRLWISSTIEPIVRIADPGGFDRRGWAASRGIHWEAFVAAGDVLAVDHRWTWTDAFAGARRGVNAWLIESGLPKRERALVKALVLGERDELDPDQVTAFARSGTIHVLAVSGMHVGLIFLGLTWMLRFMAGSLWWRIARAAILLLALWGYAGLTGASPSVLRAVIMFTSFTAANAFSARGDHLNDLCVAALASLLYDPTMLLHMGFQLSFLAVLGIITFYKPILAWWSPNGKVLRYLWSLVAVSLAAQTLTTPLSLYAFKAFPVWFLPANVVVVTATTIAVYGALVLLLTVKLPWLGDAVSWGMTMLLRFTGWATDLFASLPGAYPAVRASYWDMLLLFGIVLCIGAWWLWKWRRMRWVFAMLTSVLLVSWGLRAERVHERRQFVVYDERDGYLAAMVHGREIALCASADSILHSQRTRVKLERHQRAFGIDSVHAAHADGPEMDTFGATMRAAGRWRSAAFDVCFTTDQAPSGFTATDRLTAIVLYDASFVRDDLLEAWHGLTDRFVIAGGMPWTAREHVRKWCAEHNVACHDVRQQGAFILEP